MRRAATSPSAVCTVCSICWLVHGLVTKSDAPAFMPSTASAIEPHAVIRITGIDGVASLICRSSASPSSPDVRREKFMSWMISWHGCRRSTSSASSGEPAASDASPACFSSSASEAVTERSSSTMRIMEA